MKAVLIKGYSKKIQTHLSDVPLPKTGDNEVLIKVKAAAVNPLDLLILTGSIRLIYNYSMPLILGNECSGIVEKVGSKVNQFKEGDAVYTRLPIKKAGAFAEYIAVEENAVAKMPSNCDFTSAAAIPLTGLTAYQAITEELQAKRGDTLLITGGSGSFGQMAVPIAKSFGLNVIVTGNKRSCEQFLKIGTDRYIDYKSKNYWETLSEINYVIDTLGPSEFYNELSVLKNGGCLLSLKTGPNRAFAEKNKFPIMKKLLFTLAGAKYDKAAQKQGKKYKFRFVRSDGAQLRKITEIVEKNNIIPTVDPHIFSLEQTNEALQFIGKGHTNGKVVIRF